MGPLLVCKDGRWIIPAIYSQLQLILQLNQHDFQDFKVIKALSHSLFLHNYREINCKITTGCRRHSWRTGWWSNWCNCWPISWRNYFRYSVCYTTRCHFFNWSYCWQCCVYSSWGSFVLPDLLFLYLQLTEQIRVATVIRTGRLTLLLCVRVTSICSYIL